MNVNKYGKGQVPVLIFLIYGDDWIVPCLSLY